MDNFNVQVFDQPKQSGKFLSFPKIIFIILGLIVLAEIIYVIRVFVSPAVVPPPPQSKTTIERSIARISLTADKVSYKVNDLISVPVIINTGINRISGVDLIVRFNPKILEVTTNGLVKGTIFDEYPQVATDNDKGVISISGVSNLGNSFKGSGKFATLNLKAKTAGKVSLVVDFKKNSTAFSNLVELTTSKNILDTVDNLDLQIQ